MNVLDALKQLVNSRFFPTLSKPIIAGAIAAGITYALHALGVTSVLSGQVNGAATAIAGLLVTAIVAKPNKPDPAPPAPPNPLLQSMGDLVIDAVKAEVAANPDLVKQLVLDFVGKVMAPPAAPTAAAQGLPPLATAVVVPGGAGNPVVLSQAQEAQEDGVIR